MHWGDEVGVHVLHSWHRSTSVSFPDTFILDLCVWAFLAPQSHSVLVTRLPNSPSLFLLSFFFSFLIYWLIFRERLIFNIALFHLLMHPLVDSCMCRDQGLNLQPDWCMEMSLTNRATQPGLTIPLSVGTPELPALTKCAWGLSPPSPHIRSNPLAEHRKIRYTWGGNQKDWAIAMDIWQKASQNLFQDLEHETSGTNLSG